MSAETEFNDRIHDQLADIDAGVERARIVDLVPSRSEHEPWTWDDEARDILARECCCCGVNGHYQRALESHVSRHGLDGLGIYVENGVVCDGHHRVVAAIRLGIESVPLESITQAEARWLRDHEHLIAS